MKIKTFMSVLALAAIAATSSVAMATTGHPDIGTWYYGSSSLFGTWSQYKQCTDNYHSATVYSDNWFSSYDKDTKDDKKSYAYAVCGRGSSGTNYSYYNHWN